MKDYLQEPATFIVECNIRQLQERLEKGQMLDGRIVLVLSEHKYLLRILGVNLVMESKLRFKRFDEVKVRVQNVHPKLQLALQYRVSDRGQPGSPDFPGKTDILV